MISLTQRYTIPKVSYAVAAGAVVVLAFLLRLPGYDGRALWVDELWRVNLILESGIFERYWRDPDVYTAITAPLYLALNRGIAHLGLAPEILRLSSLISGVASVVMAFLLARKIGGGLALAFVAALLFASNGEFIQYSNEFKPYMFEVFVHLCCVYVWLDLVLSDTTPMTKWRAFFGVFAVAALCSPTVVFLLPAAGVSLLVHVQARARSQIWVAITVFGGIGLLVLLLYVFVWSYGSDKELVNYWASGFYRSQEQSYPVFVAERLLGFWRGAFAAVGLRKALPLLTLIMSFVSLGFALTTGTYFPRRTAINVAVFYIVFLLTLLSLNYVGLWPLGQLRPNQFIYAHFTMIFVFLLAFCQNSRVSHTFVGIIVVLLLVSAARVGSVKLADFGPPVEQSDKVWEAFTRQGKAGQMIDDQCRKFSASVFLNPAMSSAVNYFVRFEKSKSSDQSMLASQCVRLNGTSEAYANPGKVRQQVLDGRMPNEPMWFAYSHLNGEEVAALKTVAREFGPLSNETEFVGAGFFSVIPSEHAQAR